MVLTKLREFLERFFPSEPFKISFSRFKLILLFLLVLTGSVFFHFRSQNKNELELLKQKHIEIQLAVKNYLNSMSQISYNNINGQEIRTKLYKCRRQLSSIEEKINKIKKFWFLE